MTDNTRDYLMWKNARGRYAVGQKHHGAKAPKEGGVLAPEYRAAAGTASRPQAAAYRSHNGAVIEQSRELMPEPEALEADTMPYAPPRMAPDPFDKSIVKKADDAILETPVMELETQDTVYTPIALIPAGSVR